MNHLLYIHPLGQVCACVFGIFNAVTGITRKWFVLAIHINCGALYYFITFFGAGIGSLLAQWARTRGIPLATDVHKAMALCMIVLLAAGATTGMVMLRSTAQRARLRAYHRWINLASLILFIAQAVSGGTVLLSLCRM